MLKPNVKVIMFVYFIVPEETGLFLTNTTRGRTRLTGGVGEAVHPQRVQLRTNVPGIAHLRRLKTISKPRVLEQ